MSVLSPAAVVVDPSDGTPCEVLSIGGDRYLGVGTIQDVHESTENSTTVQLAAGASFTGTGASTLGVAGIQVAAHSDQPLRVQVQQSSDNANWDIVDSYDLPPDLGDGRTVQAVAAYCRVYVQNLGPVATTELRLQTFLCPVVEAVPRSLTPSGAMRLSKQTRSFFPSPKNFTCNETPALSQDVRGQLAGRSSVLTDELSFRSDFTLGGLYITLTGQCMFRTGETHVVGQGTSFLSEVEIGQFIRLSTDADAALTRIADVYSDTDLVLEEGYLGNNGTGVGNVTNWTYVVGTGGSLTETASEMRIASGTTAMANTGIHRPGDYLPLCVATRAKISQRIANQESVIGLMDGEYGFVEKQACVVFNDTTDTQVVFRTSFSSADVEETIVDLPDAEATDSYQDYVIELTALGAALCVNGLRLAYHTAHCPGPYDELSYHAHIVNTGVPAGSTTLTLDSVVFANFNRVDVAVTTMGTALNVVQEPGSKSTCTSVVAAVADTQLLAYNDQRKGASVYNDSTSSMYLKLGTGASATSFTVLVKGEGYYEVPFHWIGDVHAYWASATGNARVTEIE